MERERLEKQRAAEQAVHKHFEESLRLAQQKVSQPLLPVSLRCARVFNDLQTPPPPLTWSSVSNRCSTKNLPYYVFKRDWSSARYLLSLFLLLLRFTVDNVDYANSFFSINVQGTPIRVSSTYGRVLKVDSRHENKRKSLCTKSRSRLIYLELYKMMGISWGVRWSETGRFVRWRRNEDGDTNIPLRIVDFCACFVLQSRIIY